LTYRTNRILGGAAPSRYLDKLESGVGEVPPIERAALDAYLASHAIDPALLRADRFEDFMEDRQRRLLTLIAKATGHAIATSGVPAEDGEDAADDDSDLATVDQSEAA
jgi:hypothetical protein